MRRSSQIMFLYAAVVVVVGAASLQGASATGTEPPADLQADPAPCVAAATADDAGKIIAVCGALIDNEKTSKVDRIKALIARAGAYDRIDQVDHAIGDYGTALSIDPAQADIFNARGELWRKKGDRPRALQDFGAAIKLKPDFATAKSNYKSLAQELEKLGALIAINNRPSFNCATARRAVEKAICANPDLANLDREINAVNAKVVRDAASDNPHNGRAMAREQDDFITRRNAGFATPGYDLQKAMRERLDQLLAIERH